MKIIGIGTDLVSVARIKTIWERFGHAFAKRILTPNEMEELALVKNPIAFLAKRYAAKEALAKALGTGFRPNGILLTEIGVLKDPLGRPYLHFRGRTEAEIKHRQVTESHLSISDEAEFALAYVILVGVDARSASGGF